MKKEGCQNDAAEGGIVPVHVAVIMDGNGRWAARRKRPRLEGHREGGKAVESCVKAASKMGVKWLTLYAFSVENWNRPKSEVNGLMRLLVRTLRDYEKRFEKEGIRIRAIGRLADLPDEVFEALRRAEEKTAHHEGLTLQLALSYSGRVEIAEACKKLAAEVKAGKRKLSDIDEQAVSDSLYTGGVPDPDLLIRTSGEMRISNFLLWQLSYTEMVILPVLWPDFREKHFKEAVAEYGRRQRRFGGI